MSLRPVVVTAVVLLLAANASATLQLPPNVTAEAAGPGGAVVQFAASANGAGDDENGRPLSSATCTPPSGSLFPLGRTTVTCRGDNTTGSFDVNVVDTTAPMLSLPRDFTVPAGASVTFDATAADTVDGSVAVTCNPSSGSTFPLGTTTVRCSAIDAHFNRASGSFAVTVSDAPPPSPPPVGVPQNITAEATGPGGAFVTFLAYAGEDENGRPTGTAACSPASGSLFPLGDTLVQCSNGNSSASFHVTVVDATAPVLSLPGNLSAPATSAAGATVAFDASAADLVDGSVAVTCAPPSGSTFAIGTTSVSCSASDSLGNTASGSFLVTVTPQGNDTMPPVIAHIAATPDTLSPPNHKMVSVALTVEATDDIDPAPVSRIFDVQASETIPHDDWTITGPLTVDLRAERSGSGDRVYTVFVDCIDAAGNRAVGTVQVRVPHDSSPSRRRAGG